MLQRIIEAAPPPLFFSFPVWLLLLDVYRPFRSVSSLFVFREFPDRYVPALVGHLLSSEIYI